MTTLTIQLPDSFEKERDDTVHFLAAKMYESGKLTLGQAAEMAGVKKWDFPAVLVEYDVAYFQYTLEDIMADVERISKK